MAGTVWQPSQAANLSRPNQQSVPINCSWSVRHRIRKVGCRTVCGNQVRSYQLKATASRWRVRQYVAKVRRYSRCWNEPKNANAVQAAAQLCKEESEPRQAGKSGVNRLIAIQRGEQGGNRVAAGRCRSGGGSNVGVRSGNQKAASVTVRLCKHQNPNPACNCKVRSTRANGMSARVARASAGG